MNTFFIQYLIPFIAVLASLFLGVNELVFMTLAWMAAGICLFFLGLFSICFWGLKKESSPIARAVWPVMATDMVLFSKFNTFSAVSVMLFVSLVVSPPLMFPVFFGAAALASLYLLVEHSAEAYGPVIEKTENRHGDGMYKDDDSDD